MLPSDAVDGNMVRFVSTPVDARCEQRVYLLDGANTSLLCGNRESLQVDGLPLILIMLRRINSRRQALSLGYFAAHADKVGVISHVNQVSVAIGKLLLEANTGSTCFPGLKRTVIGCRHSQL